MKKFTLSKVSTALALVYASLPVSAEIQVANSQTQVSRQAGVEVVNIAKPTASGLSHNQYQKFNVETSGAVFNNARQAGQSQLAGQLAGNANLQQGSAKVILNEVVSRSPSVIAGQQEIFGQRADYVLANPNGIAHQGGGFINTAKASLVVGTANVKNGSLNGFDVSGKSALSSTGTLNGNLEQLDLIAPVVQIQGRVEGARATNIIEGQNNITRDANGQLQIQVQKASGAVLDGKVLGSIYSDRIRIHSTDERATLNLTGASLEAKDTVISAGNALLSGNVESKLQHNDRNYTADKKVKVKESSSERTQTLQKTKLNTDSLVIDVRNNLTLSATDIRAKQAIISGGHTVLNGQTTLDSSTSTNNRSKGAWYRNDSKSSSTQTLHQTSIGADDLTLASTKGALIAESVKFDTKNALFYSENGIEFKGKNQSTQQTLESNYRNETAKLKTGRNFVDSNVETFIPTELNVAENLRIGGKGEVTFSGVKGKVDGNLVAESADKITFTSQASRVRREIDDKEKYWGGIGGSNSGSAKVNELVQHGSDLNIKGLAYLDANNGVQITGSRVLAGEGYVRGNQGKLLIDSAYAQSTAHTASRKGTIFNITKARNEAFSSVTTAQGSTLKSDSNLHLISDSQIDVVGSKVLASGLLDVSAKNVNVKGAQNHTETSQSSYALGFSKKFEKVPGKMNMEGLINEVIDTWLDGRMVDDPLKLFWDHRTYKRAVSATLGVQSESQKTAETTHSSAHLAGGDLAVVAGNLALAGSQLEATKGSVSLKADRIQTQAQLNTTQTESKEKNIGLTIGATATEKGINTYVTLGGQGTQKQAQQQKAQSSVIQAVENVVLNANRITHQATALNAKQGSVIENADVIRHETAQSTNFSNTQTVKGGLTVSVNVDKKFNHTYGVELGMEGSRDSQLQRQNSLTSISSGQDVVVSGKQVTDIGTQYQAGSNVEVSADSYKLQSAIDSTHSDKLSAGAKIGVALETNGGKDLSAKVSVGANYQQNQSGATSVQQANVNGQNVHISANNINAQGNFSATQSVVLNAVEQLVLSQSEATTQKSGGGFKANVAVGGIVKGGAPIPSVDVSLSANGEKGQSQTAVMNQINGKQVVLQSAGNNRLQGTNIQGETVVIGGQNVELSAGVSNAMLNEGSASLSVGVGKGVSSVKAEGKFSVNVEKENSHTATQISANNLAIVSANDVQMNGVQVEAQNVSIDSGNGDVVLNALKDNKKKTGVSAGLALNGDLKDKQWNAKGGSASVAVDVVRNETHTVSSINASNVALNVNGNVALNGSAINAESVNGSVSGNVVSTSATDQINETSVALSASGSGAYRPYRAPKLLLALKKDWDNGAIAGIKAEVAGAVSVVRKQRGLPTGINATNNNLSVGGTTVTATTAPNYSYSYANQGKLTTNLKQEYYKPWRVKTFGQ